MIVSELSDLASRLSLGPRGALTALEVVGQKLLRGQRRPC